MIKWVNLTILNLKKINEIIKKNLRQLNIICFFQFLTKKIIQLHLQFYKFKNV